MYIQRGERHMQTFFRKAAIVAATALAAAAHAQSGKHLTISLPAMPTGYSVVASAGLADILATNLIGEGLTRWKKDTLEVEPALATSWSANADATVWTFKLRHGVKWHDGQPFTAEDVKYTFDLILDKKVRAAAAGQVEGLKSVTVKSPDEVQLTFEHPIASLPVMLAYRMEIVPKHALQGQDPNQPAEFVKKPIGTGPFMFQRATSGQSWTTVRNPDWWGGKVTLEGVDLKITPDANSAVAQLKSEAVDVALVQPQQIGTLEGGPVAVSVVEQPSVYYVTLANNKPPFDDVRVRQALNYAVDTDAIIKAVVGGYATKATGIIAPSIKGYTDKVAKYHYDPAKAKALLAEAGWKLENGKLMKNGQQMQMELTTSAGVVGGPQLTQILQQELSQIGVDAKIKMVDFRGLWTGVFSGEIPTSVEYLNLQPSPDITNALVCKGSYNRFSFCDKKVDQMLAEGASITNEAKSDAKYAELQRYVAENVPGILLYYPKEIRAINKRVQNFPRNPIRMATTHLFDVTLK
jgi:peptide/nickel transport system substrate-binding protein